MIPTRIELENFLSFGTPAVVFTFTDDEPLWVLCGRNGVGKSAVFDGITYALYGEHRAGTQKAEQLIRHGANGFRVVLEFEFAGSAYRITRARAGRTTQKVERLRDGEWEAVPGVNTAAEVKAWVERTRRRPRPGPGPRRCSSRPSNSRSSSPTSRMGRSVRAAGSGSIRPTPRPSGPGLRRK